MNKLKNYLRGAAAGLTTFALAPAAYAAGSDTGVEAGFFELGTDLTTVLNGAGGFAILIASVLIAAFMVIIGRGFGAAAGAAAVALFLGYGVTTLSSFAGVTAGVDMVSLETPLVEVVNAD